VRNNLQANIIAASNAEAPTSAAPEWVASAAREPGPGRALELVGHERSSPCLSSLTSQRILLFDGVLYNRHDVAAELGVPRSANLSDADLLLLAYERWDVGLARRIKGIFALVVVDQLKREIVAVRDPLGEYPLFYAEASDRLLFSTSIDRLREHGAGRRLNRAALADHLCHRWPDLHETYFAGIRRVPPGHLMRSSSAGTTVSRYWEPVAADQPVRWITEDELHEQFGTLFEQAVERALGRGRAGLFLSGGLDSISVSAITADLARRDGRPLPLALSLGFPGDAGEELEQRGVAGSLGLEHEFVPFEEAAPGTHLLTDALAITQTRPAPLLNTWMPAYTDLALRGKRRGVQTILSGAGGDEWLAVSPFIAADLIRTGDVRQLGKLVAAWKRSYDMSPLSVARCLGVKYGIRPLASSLLDRMAPHAWKANRLRRSVKSTFDWVAPDRQLHAALDERIEKWLPAVTPEMGFYLQDVRRTMDHPLMALELEEIFEMGRHLEVRFLHPFWDADVVDILYRTPPLLLFAGGRAKSIVRDTMTKRFPGLGLDRQKKRAGTTFYQTVLDREIPELWRRHGDLTALADLGVVDPRAAAAMVENTLSKDLGIGKVRIWDVMNLETWVRAHQ
jgi:asparagine synthetase B (glutamine-hydrolysing)